VEGRAATGEDDPTRRHAALADTLGDAAQPLGLREDRLAR
jgi:hypothetical protein